MVLLTSIALNMLKKEQQDYMKIAIQTCTLCLYPLYKSLPEPVVWLSSQKMSRIYRKEFYVKRGENSKLFILTSHKPLPFIICRL